MCVSSSISILLLTITACINAILTRNMVEVNPITLALITVITNVLTAISTHYFTKQRSNPAEPLE